MSETLLEKLQFKDEKNLLIQGLPSSIEKQFFKLTFAKNITPLLKIRKIDFALVFAVNETQLEGIINEVIPALHTEGKLWVAYPKKTSKIATTLNRDCSWNCIASKGFTEVRQVSLDHVWTAIRFKKTEQIPHLARASANGGVPAIVEGVNHEKRVVQPPSDFLKGLNRNKTASHFFDNLSFTNKKEYVTWVTSAKREDTRSRRLESAIDKLSAGKKNPSEK